MTKPLILTPGAVTLRQLQIIFETACPVALDASCMDKVTASRATVEAAAAGQAPVYGINTGFGKLASTQIPPEDTATLQRNLILSHCCGVGEPISDKAVHLLMALKLMSFGRGASGVRLELIALMEGMLAHGVYPVIPRQGSVGASGDLAPLAHMAAALIGEGEVRKDGERMPALGGLKLAGLKPVELSAKEGLALINGTQFSTAIALKALFAAWRNMQNALIASSLSTDAIMGSTAPLHPTIHALRGHTGQIETAATMRALLDGSEIRESHVEGDERVQDPYCIRCQPQVTGAAMDLLRQIGQTLRIEANAATDNPLVCLDDGQILSGGNFHAEPVAFAADQMALAIAEIGAISQRRIAMTVDPALSFGLPPFLTPRPGLNSGYMIAEVTSAALMSENKQLTHPASVDSTPTSANQEDHVSMAAHAAVRLQKMNRNLAQIIGIEMLTGAQGVEFRAPLKTSAPLQRVIDVIRRHVKTMGDDRYLADDLTKSAILVSDDTIIDAAGRDLFPELEPDQ